MSEPNDWNKKIIEEFHANDGKVGGVFAGFSILLLTTTGAKSGRQYITPLAYLPHEDRVIIFAANGGAPTHPDWYHNLKAHPQVEVELGTEKFAATAIIITGEERDRLCAGQSALARVVVEYQAKTERLIPVIELKRLS